MTADATSAPIRRVHPAADRIFFGAMALFILAVCLIAFGPTYYLRPSTEPALPIRMQAHGIVLTGWMLLFIAQSALISARRVDLHRAIGIGGMAFAVAVAVFATWEAVVRRGLTRELVFSAVAILMFGGFVIAGCVTRRQPGAHKRYMLLATIALLAPAVARLPVHLLPRSGLNSNIETLLFLIPPVAYDFATRRSLHPVMLWGGLITVAMVPVRVILKEYVF